MKGPRQHCDMLRRQYKYLISPNGNHHSALIVPHIIQSGRRGCACSCVCVYLQRTSPFDSCAVIPSPLPLAHLSPSFFCSCSLFLDHMSLSDQPPTAPPRLPAFLVTSLSHRCYLSLSDVFVCLCSPPHFITCVPYCAL